ncbi:3-oxoacyl-[acyl-carrier-protein] reductase [Stygiobacter electus]|jgi:3-oxoacyl-[acyl-carrier protein] reductase|uniref:3-oxoacyl-[acyl-carrier-protein] reductase n=1 Tax=Stygiobacter electus TaxID=3032292 RepID=A0AAE3TCJ5_9BACT|nr:3-oxoacyl-[acyl-carrier-protein] reductase [Stygiobacter electus]MDF1612493.1 3-oxoacyl-[acyl-carrier-protein] reductase [Stygiobacter electus]
MKLHNKKAIVTGGTRGIGKAIVKELVDNGCNVVFTYHSSDETAKKIEKEFSTENVKVYGIKADATSFTQAEEVVKFTLEKFGSIDILVNNAGITKDNLLLRMSETDFDAVINANLKSVFNYTKAILKPFLSQKFGKIVNISSVVGIIGNPGQANYVASKAGVIGLTKSNAKELASRNINVNCVAPGFIETDMTEKLNEQQRQAILSNVPIKRLGKPEDVAKAVLFLSSNDSDYITGQVIIVDGGLVM